MCPLLPLTDLYRKGNRITDAFQLRLRQSCLVSKKMPITVRFCCPARENTHFRTWVGLNNCNTPYMLPLRTKQLLNYKTITKINAWSSHAFCISNYAKKHSKNEIIFIHFSSHMLHFIVITIAMQKIIAEDNRFRNISNCIDLEIKCWCSLPLSRTKTSLCTNGWWNSDCYKECIIKR